QGTPVGDDSAPTLQKIEVSPTQRVLSRSASQQLAVLAHYSDGSTRDVTRQAQYQSNEIVVAAVDDDGLVRSFDLAGEARLIDRLLEDKDYPAYFALRWGSILRNSQLAGAEQAAYAFHEWIRDMIARNRPYDEFVRGVVAAAGEWQEAPAVNWYWQMRDDQLHQPVADTAQLFLGLRLQCAKCHHHPYERWSQDDYYGLAGFFSRVGRKGPG